MTKREFAAEFVEIHVTDGIGTLLLARPPRNALTRQMCREITAAAEELGQRPDVTAVIVYGGHEVFCTGDDDHETSTLDAAEARYRLLLDAHRLWPLDMDDDEHGEHDHP